MCFVFHDVSQHFMKCGRPMSDISRDLCFFLSHCLTASSAWGCSSEQPLCGTSRQNLSCCPCQLWPFPQLAPFWSQSTAASRRSCGCSYSLAFPYWQTGQLGVRIAQCTWGILLFLFSTFGSPSSGFFTFSFCRDRDELFYLDFLPSCSSAVLQRAMP